LGLGDLLGPRNTLLDAETKAAIRAALREHGVLYGVHPVMPRAAAAGLSHLLQLWTAAVGCHDRHTETRAKSSPVWRSWRIRRLLDDAPVITIACSCCSRCFVTKEAPSLALSSPNVSPGRFLAETLVACRGDL
jgi:hypothetical protein